MTEPNLDQWKLEIDDASAVMRQATDRIAADAGLIERQAAKLAIYEARIRKYQVVVDAAMDAKWTRPTIEAVEDVFWYELGLGKEVKNA